MWIEVITPGWEIDVDRNDKNVNDCLFYATYGKKEHDKKLEMSGFLTNSLGEL